MTSNCLEVTLPGSFSQTLAMRGQAHSRRVSCKKKYFHNVAFLLGRSLSIHRCWPNSDLLQRAVAGACSIKSKLNKRRGENVSLQDLWRYCQKCHVMFYDGYPNKGLCAAGGAHEGQGYDFFLPYALPETANDQAGWRYCEKCHAIFYDGFPDKGRCPGGNGHVAQEGSFLFTLPHDRPE